MLSSGSVVAATLVLALLALLTLRGLALSAGVLTRVVLRRCLGVEEPVTATAAMTVMGHLSISLPGWSSIALHECNRTTRPILTVVL
jgi:hypothetical protein